MNTMKQDFEPDLQRAGLVVTTFPDGSCNTNECKLQEAPFIHSSLSVPVADSRNSPVIYNSIWWFPKTTERGELG